MQHGFPNARMSETYRRMEHYYALAQWSACPLQRWRYENLMMVEVRRFMDWSRKEQNAMIQVLQSVPQTVHSAEAVEPSADESSSSTRREQTPPTSDQTAPSKAFTLTELAQYDGAGGRPAYVAVDRVVYDVSREATWGGATHFGLYAGRDLTPQFAGCHGKAEILRNLPRVGVLVS